MYIIGLEDHPKASNINIDNGSTSIIKHCWRDLLYNYLRRAFPERNRQFILKLHEETAVSEKGEITVVMNPLQHCDNDDAMNRNICITVNDFFEDSGYTVKVILI